MSVNTINSSEDRDLANKTKKLDRQFTFKKGIARLESWGRQITGASQATSDSDSD
jgi:hypothetical protein